MTCDELIVYLKLASPEFFKIGADSGDGYGYYAEPGGYLKLAIVGDAWCLRSVDETIEIGRGKCFPQLAIDYGYQVQGWTENQLRLHALLWQMETYVRSCVAQEISVANSSVDETMSSCDYRASGDAADAEDAEIRN